MMTYQNSGDRIKQITLFICFISMVVFIWLDEWFPVLADWEKHFLSYPVLLTLMGFLVIPLLYLYSFEMRESMNSISWKPVIVALKSLAIVGPATALSFVPIMLAGYSHRSWPGGIWIALVQLATLPALIWYLRDLDDGKLMRPPKPELIGYGLIIGILLMTVLHQFSLTAERAILALFAIGFAEECFFRGFLQTQLNRWWPKPISFMDCRLSWGWIIASLLFGLMHFLSPSGPFNMPWAIWTFIGGLQFGLIARLGGSFLSSAIVHGVVMMYPVVTSYI